MPIVDTTQAAALTFDAAVNRALSRRRSDTPYPHNGASVASPAPAPDAAQATPPVEPVAAAIE